MLDELEHFLTMLEVAIPPGKDQHHNFTVEENKLYLWLMLGKEYIPITFLPEDKKLSVEDLVEDIARIPAVKQAINDNQ